MLAAIASKVIHRALLELAMQRAGDGHLGLAVRVHRRAVRVGAGMDRPGPFNKLIVCQSLHVDSLKYVNNNEHTDPCQILLDSLL